jgi:hypothetical protein
VQLGKKKEKKECIKVKKLSKYPYLQMIRSYTLKTHKILFKNYAPSTAIARSRDIKST